MRILDIPFAIIAMVLCIILAWLIPAPGLSLFIQAALTWSAVIVMIVFLELVIIGVKAFLNRS